MYIRGFWFPNLRTCAEKLGVDKGTVLRWKKSPNGGDVVNRRKPKPNSLEKPCYVGGIWFPTLSQASASLKVTRSALQKRIVAGYVEEQDNKSKVTGEGHPNSIPVEIHGIKYASVLEASKLSGYTYRAIQYRIQTKKEGFVLLE